MAKKIIRIIKENRLLSKLVQMALYFCIRLFIKTYRIRIKHADKTETLSSGIFYAWHQNIIAATAFFVKKKKRPPCIVSPSHDGKIIGAIGKQLGLQILYGSANKNTITVVRKALRILKDEKMFFLIGDGSRGPAKQLQPGPIYLSKKASLPLTFIDCKVEWCITLRKSWDNFQIPLPFSKIWIELKRCSFT